MSIYYSPEKFGLETIFSVDLDDEPYQFNILCVWYHKETNKYYAARDSGCSCPTPFEYYTSIDSLEEIQNFDGVIAMIKSARGLAVLEKQELITKLQRIRIGKVKPMKKTIEFSISEVEAMLLDSIKEETKDKQVTVRFNKDNVVVIIQDKQ